MVLFCFQLHFMSVIRYRIMHFGSCCCCCCCCRVNSVLLEVTFGKLDFRLIVSPCKLPSELSLRLSLLDLKDGSGGGCSSCFACSSSSINSWPTLTLNLALVSMYLQCCIRSEAISRAISSVTSLLSLRSDLFPTRTIGTLEPLSLKMSSQSLTASWNDCKLSTEKTRTKPLPERMLSSLIAGKWCDPAVSRISTVWNIPSGICTVCR